MSRKLPLLLFLAVAAVLAMSSLAAADPVGTLTEFNAGLNAGSIPFRIASSADGNLWFSDQGPTKAIGRISPDGSITEFPLPPASAPRQVRVGADGNIWFTDTSPTAPLIGRITPDGTITTYSLPAGSFPNALAVGPDDALWVTDKGTTPAIRRVATDGTITTYSAGLNSGSAPNGITPGSDGALWFTDQGTTKAIGRITLDGTITESSTGLNTGANPAAIAPGPDGNLWFTDQGATKAIGKITLPDGTISETALAATANPQEVTPGADGALWFTDRGATKQLGRVSTDGTITLFPTGIPTTSSPGGIRTGPDGNLWFLDNGVPQAVARYGIGAPAASLTRPSVAGRGAEGVAQNCSGATWSDWAGTQPSLDRFGFDGYRWKLDGAPIAGATFQTYTPTIAELGHQLSCAVTVTYTLFPTTVSTASAPVLVKDSTAPLLTLPGTITVDATSPHGTSVSYTSGATDNVDPNPTVTCSPGSGSTFPIGTTNVSCSSTDAAENSATGSFAIIVKSAAVQLNELAAAVEGVGPGKSLTATVAIAQSLLAHHAPRLACVALDIFNLEVRTWSGRTIPRELSATLIAESQRIESVIGC